MCSSVISVTSTRLSPRWNLQREISLDLLQEPMIHWGFCLRTLQTAVPGHLCSQVRMGWLLAGELLQKWKSLVLELRATTCMYFKMLLPRYWWTLSCSHVGFCDASRRAYAGSSTHEDKVCWWLRRQVCIFENPSGSSQHTNHSKAWTVRCTSVSSTPLKCCVPWNQSNLVNHCAMLTPLYWIRGFDKEWKQWKTE